MTKFALTTRGESLPNGVVLKTIIARIDFVTVTGVQITAGDEGGLVQSEANLSQHGNCWIEKGGIVYGKAKVSEDAFIGAGVEVNGRTLVKGSMVMAKTPQETLAKLAAGDALAAMPL